MKRATVPLLVLIPLLCVFTSCKPKGETRFLVELTPTELTSSLEVIRQEYMAAITERLSQEPELELVEVKAGTRPKEVEVSLAGVKDPNAVMSLLTNRGKVEFLETAPYSEGFEVIMAWNEKMKTIPELYDSASFSTPAEEGTGSWLDSLGGTEPDLETQRIDFLKEYPLFEYLSPLERVIDPYYPLIGYALAGDIEDFEKIINHPALKAIQPERISFHWERKSIGEEQPLFGLVGVKQVAPDLVISNENITKAEIGSNEGTEEFVINLTFDEDASHSWEILTRKNVGKCVAILLDGQVISYPTVQEEITGGNTQISGNFEFEEAYEMLRFFKLPALPQVEVEVLSTSVPGKTPINR